jgi:hypothetical protein
VGSKQSLNLVPNVSRKNLDLKRFNKNSDLYRTLNIDGDLYYRFVFKKCDFDHFFANTECAKAIHKQIKQIKLLVKIPGIEVDCTDGAERIKSLLVRISPSTIDKKIYEFSTIPSNPFPT